MENATVDPWWSPKRAKSQGSHSCLVQGTDGEREAKIAWLPLVHRSLLSWWSSTASLLAFVLATNICSRKENDRNVCCHGPGGQGSEVPQRAGPCAPKALRERPPVPLPASGGSWHFWVCGCIIAPTSIFVFLWLHLFFQCHSSVCLS